MGMCVNLFFQRKSGTEEKTIKNCQILNAFGKRSHILCISWHLGRTDHNLPWTERSRELQSFIIIFIVSKNFLTASVFIAFLLFYLDHQPTAKTAFHIVFGSDPAGRSLHMVTLTLPFLLWMTLNLFNNPSSNCTSYYENAGWEECAEHGKMLMV